MLLEDIKHPGDLKKMSYAQLDQLALELRQKIIEQVGKNGGHLAPNLGVIELTLALHKVFDTPHDKFIWDVGHQAYAHKLLTGRQKEFESLRLYKGMSGFPKRSESEHDAFGVGHASTSISAALGFAVGRDLNEDDNSVVAIIGDGSMTGGMVFEALNNLGSTKNITIILNDNKMSIAPNVGTFSRYLNRVISDPTYNRLRDDWHNLLQKLPGGIGRRVEDIMGRAETIAKAVFKPGRLFEDLGARYFGPIDGHSIPDLMEIFNRVKTVGGVNLIHVITEKGRGLSFSEEDPYHWHGTVPFDPDSGSPLSKPKTQPALTTIFGDAMLEMARNNPKLVGITGAMPSGCGLNIMEAELPNQVFDVGIAEAHAVTFAAGLACEGIVPVVAIYSSFMQRAFDQVIHDVALQELHVIFAMDRAGLVGADGPTHHGVFDLSYMRMVPNMVIMAPSDEVLLRNMLYTAVNHCNGPVSIRFPRGSALTDLKECPDFEEVEVGKYAIIEEGSEVLLVGVGFMLQQFKKTAQILKENGINPTLVDARFVKPIDEDSWAELIQKHQHLVVLEDNAKIGGFGATLMELSGDRDLNTKIHRFALPDEFVEQGELDELYAELGIDGESVARTMLNRLGRN
ncbi:MAG: 1-deoxy-D-xylulose-5-phosphate synthase [Fibrobacter sp.]|nr:1-deoxy-D-xylulose-5-phosphate synthase [Fibrobacter sp.]